MESAKQLDLKTIGSKQGQSAGGKVSVSLAKVHSLAVGSTKLADVDVGIVDLAHIGKTIGARIDGDLGYNFLKHFRITIDYQACEIRLDDPKRIESFGRAAITEVPIRLASPAKPLVLVDVYANGARAVSIRHRHRNIDQRDHAGAGETIGYRRVRPLDRPPPAARMSM